MLRLSFPERVLIGMLIIIIVVFIVGIVSINYNELCNYVREIR